MASPPASLLTIPCELRNAVYSYIFTSDPSSPPELTPTPVPKPLQDLSLEPRCHPSALSILLTCRQIHTEAAVLALSQTAFHLIGEAPHPQCFASQASPLRPEKLSALRHITVTSRISSFRAMNESWSGLPFGNAALNLDTLTIIPTRADSSRSAYQEVADLSQSHTLAYVFAETLKGLRNVGMVQVVNGGCFNEVVWRLLYRATVYRMWRWGGGRCGVRFECSGDEVGGGEEWFRVFLNERNGRRGSEVGDEVVRLVGVTGELPAGVEELDG